MIPNIVYYQSEEQTINCKDGGVLLRTPHEAELQVIEVHVSSQQSEKAPRSKKKVENITLNHTKTAPNNMTRIVMKKYYSLSTEEETITLPVDSMYLLLVQLKHYARSRQSDSDLPQSDFQNGPNISAQVQWMGRQGFLGPSIWPLLSFFGTMCCVYGMFAFSWLIVSAFRWKNFLRVHVWIGAVILLAMLEQAVWYAEFRSLNATGRSVKESIQLAELVSCLKRTLARMLVIVLSVGFGVVKPLQKSSLYKVAGVGFVYFILVTVEGIIRVSKAQSETQKKKLFLGVPLTLLEMGIFWWIFSSLVKTMRTLRLQRDEVNLALYRRFTNTLIFATLAGVTFMVWSLSMHVFPTCRKNWKELWVDTAFWHLLLSMILLVIIILWRPTNSNEGYDFTPLSDKEDEDEGNTSERMTHLSLFSEAFDMTSFTLFALLLIPLLSLQRRNPLQYCGLNSTRHGKNRRERENSASPIRNV